MLAAAARQPAEQGFAGRMRGAGHAGVQRRLAARRMRHNYGHNSVCACMWLPPRTAHRLQLLPGLHARPAVTGQGYLGPCSSRCMPRAHRLVVLFSCTTAHTKQPHSTTSSKHSFPPTPPAGPRIVAYPPLTAALAKRVGACGGRRPVAGLYQVLRVVAAFEGDHGRRPTPEDGAALEVGLQPWV